MAQTLKQPGKPRLKLSQLQRVMNPRTGYMSFLHNGTPFSGYVVMDYHGNGYVMFEEEYQDGEYKGWRTQYADDGKLVMSHLMLDDTILKTQTYDGVGIMESEEYHVSMKYYESLIKNKIIQE